jgi:hypothetical protein
LHMHSVSEIFTPFFINLGNSNFILGNTTLFFVIPTLFLVISTLKLE